MVFCSGISCSLSVEGRKVVKGGIGRKGRGEGKGGCLDRVLLVHVYYAVPLEYETFHCKRC
jgi:hypothetical protein